MIGKLPNSFIDTQGVFIVRLSILSSRESYVVVVARLSWLAKATCRQFTSKISGCFGLRRGMRSTDWCTELTLPPLGLAAASAGETRSGNREARYHLDDGG